jgi:hypothetical protein
MTADPSDRPPASGEADFRLRSVVRPPNARLSFGTSYDTNSICYFPNRTRCVLATIVGDPELIRFVFSNGNKAAYTLKGYWAPTARVGNGWTPCRPDGEADPSLFAPITFNGGGADLAPTDTPPGDALIATIRPNTAAYFSDWMPAGHLLPRIDAADGMRLALVRTRPTSTEWGFGIGAAEGVHNDDPITGGVSALFASDAPIDDLASASFQPDRFTHLVAVQVISRTRGYTVVYAGSSILTGTTTVPLNRQCFTRIACHAMTRMGIPFAAIKANVDGVPSTGVFAASTLAKIETLQPDFVLIQVSNRNDGPYDRATQDRIWGHVTDMAEATIRHGGLPILVTATPWNPGNAPDAATDAMRQVNNDRARRSGMVVFDYDALLTDGGSPARLLPKYNDSGDETHPGLTGHAFAGERLAALFTSLVTPRLQQDPSVLRRAAEARARRVAVRRVVIAAVVVVAAAILGLGGYLALRSFAGD